MKNLLNGLKHFQDMTKKGYKPEYILCRQIATYLKAQYPDVLFRFDQAGLNLSKTQAGMNKAIQHSKGFPDLMILEKRAGYGGLFVELKREGARLFKKNGEPATEHIGDQIVWINNLNKKGYATAFGLGFDGVKKLIDNYLNLK